MTWRLKSQATLHFVPHIVLANDKKTLKLWIAGALWNQWSPVDSPYKILVMRITTITLRCLVLCGRCLFYPIRVRFVKSHYKKIGIDRISTSHENGATPGYILVSIGGNKFTLISEQNGRQFADDTLGLFIPLKQKSINIKNHVFPLICRFYFNCIQFVDAWYRRFTYMWVIC